MNTKEEWINHTMESLDGAGCAALNPFVREKILQRINTPEPVTDSIKFSIVWKVAAVILLLISLNVFTLVYFSRTSGIGQGTSRSVASEYFSYIDNYNF
jgi:hypothetical protein